MGQVPAIQRDPSHPRNRCADSEDRAYMARGTHLLKCLGLLMGRLPIAHNGPTMAPHVPQGLVSSRVMLYTIVE